MALILLRCRNEYNARVHGALQIYRSGTRAEFIEKAEKIERIAKVFGFCSVFVGFFSDAVCLERSRASRNRRRPQTLVT